MTRTQISVKGQQTWVPEFEIDQTSIVVTGGWMKRAAIRDEDYVEGDPSGNAEKLLAELRERKTGADLFSFQQRIPDLVPRYSYPMRWDNVAAVPITTYENWLSGLSSDTRRNVRLAAKRGITTVEASYTEDFVRGIKGIYDETPVRHGKRFWHYGKPLEAVRSENATYADRSVFIGAYVGDELAGFIKMVTVGTTASIMQILSKVAHQDKKCTNALLGKAAEVCATRGLSHLIYCKYTYHRDYEDPLTEFKRRHGFRAVLLPRYYVPLTAKGQLALQLNLQSGVQDVLPRKVLTALLRLRAKYYASRQTETRDAVYADR